MGLLEELTPRTATNSAFVRASSYRASVMQTLRDWSKTTGQVALACGLSLPHASRALRELVTRDLVVCATPDLRGRGRLYALTAEGIGLSNLLDGFESYPVMTPQVRSTHPMAWYQVLSSRFGTGRAREVLSTAGCEKVIPSTARWVPLRCQLKLLNEVELRFGDGTYSTVRRLASEAVRYYPSVRKLLLRALPLRLLVDLTPGAYLKEFNHGRLEIDQSPGTAKFRHYDWLSSPARCSAWLGSYEGAFSWMRKRASVTKEGCILKGNEYCGYVAAWDE